MRVAAARARQIKRAGKANYLLAHKELATYCAVKEGDYQLLEQAINHLGLSARAYHRILKVARTIADLADSDNIKTNHLSEAISYRRLDTSGG